jgi:predicted DCC family thiol-disulfide oxidoreductase YuxK
VLVDADGAHARSDAALRIAGGLRAPWRWLAALGAAGVRDALYDALARRRYRWFGRRDIPAAAARASLA